MIKRFLKYFVLLLVILVLALFLWNRNKIGVGLGDGYRLVDTRLDYVHIIKNDKAVVLPAIVDFYESSDFIAGIRFPSLNMECGSGYLIILSLDKERFFLLNKKNNNVMHFNSRRAFEEKLAKLGIINSVRIDYSKFETVRRGYSKFYNPDKIANCKPYPVGTKEYEHYIDPSNN